MDDKRMMQTIRNAITQGNVDKVLELIQADPSILKMMTPFGTWLHVAAAHGQLPIVKALLDLGADINVHGGIEESSPLHLAASNGRVDVVDFLLSAGAKMDVSTPDKNPLFGAIYGDHLAVVKRLIEQGIDTRLKYSGKTFKDRDALRFAREWGRTEIADLLAGQ